MGSSAEDRGRARVAPPLLAHPHPHPHPHGGEPFVIACRGGLCESVGEVGFGGCPDDPTGVVAVHPSGTGRLARVSDLAGEIRMFEEATDRLGLAAGLDVYLHQRMTDVMPTS